MVAISFLSSASRIRSSKSPFCLCLEVASMGHVADEDLLGVRQHNGTASRPIGVHKHRGSFVHGCNTKTLERSSRRYEAFNNV